jgi:hypothetical protein
VDPKFDVGVHGSPLRWLLLHPLKNILNRILWNEKERHEVYIITYVHRGAPDDSRKIPFTAIKKIGKSWFSLMISGEEVQIPFHRIITVENTQTGKLLWQKRS